MSTELQLLAEIFKRLPNNFELENTQLVCPRWHSVIDTTVGKDISIYVSSHSSYYGVIPVESMGLDVISTIGIRSCLIDFDFYTKLSQEEKKSKYSKPVKFKYPFLVKHLSLNGQLNSNQFKSIMNGVRNLTMLEISLYTIFQAKSLDLMNLELPCLKKLEVHKSIKANWKGFDETLAIPNLQAFLEANVFSTLLILEIRFPVSTFGDFSTIKLLLKFIQIHWNLRELFVTMDFPVRVVPLNRHTYQNSLDDIVAELKKYNGSLKTVDIHAVRLHGSYPQLQIWKEVLQKQSCLKSLSLRIGALSNIFLEAVCVKNSSTLESLFIYKLNETQDDEQALPLLDCKVFVSLKSLTTIYALGSEEVVNIKQLPCSVLSAIFLTGVIRTDETECILLEIPTLRFITLRNAYRGRDGYGVSLSILKKFVTKRQVNRLVLNGSSLSEPFPEDGIWNLDSSKPEMLAVEESWEDDDHCYLDWKLNASNYYVNMYYY